MYYGAITLIKEPDGNFVTVEGKYVPDTWTKRKPARRFLLPSAFIRMAGGRGLLPDGGKSCFLSGANAAITGDMLTTAGITVQTDLQMLTELGYEVKLDETTDDHRH